MAKKSFALAGRGGGARKREADDARGLRGGEAHREGAGLERGDLRRGEAGGVDDDGRQRRPGVVEERHLAGRARRWDGGEGRGRRGARLGEGARGRAEVRGVVVINAAELRRSFETDRVVIPPAELNRLVALMESCS